MLLFAKYKADSTAKVELERLKGKPSSVRRTDNEVVSLPLNWPRKKASAVDCHRGTLKLAATDINQAGVYILYLSGRMMKVGAAEIGIQKRMQQYYGLNPSCGHPKITEKNRNQIQVVWQFCPKCKCNELESKLAKKYGKGPWAERVPHSAADTWDLLI